MEVDFSRIVKQAQACEPDISRFLRDLIALPSESTHEEAVINRIREEMLRVGFDKVDIDPMGNVIGTLGHGSHLIAMDAHIDTVGIGDPKQWNFDPIKGYEDATTIGGRGASDQKGGMASLVYYLS